MKKIRQPSAERYLTLAHAFLPPIDAAANDLTLAYTRLFLGPGQPIAHPCESVYVDGQLMGSSAVQVQKRYIEAGLQLNVTSDEIMPDHISIELVFMAHLIIQESLDTEQAEIWRKRQRIFLFQHLGRWMPQFCQKIENSGIHPFYCQAAQAGIKLIEDDLIRLSIPREALEEQPIDASQPSNAPAIVDSPPHSQEQKYPNIHLEINNTLCTLCTFCTDKCTSDALSTECVPDTIRLIFDPASCNGCRKCLRLCPEHAIKIVKGPPLSTPVIRQTSVLASAPRVICPDCHRPHIAKPWLERLTERLGGGLSIQHSLARCPTCKIISVSDPPYLVGSTQETPGYA